MVGSIAASPFGPLGSDGLHGRAEPAHQPWSGRQLRSLAGWTFVVLVAMVSLPVPLAAQVAVSLDWTDRTRITSYEDEQRQLERDLLAVDARADFAAFLNDHGYMVTSINEDSEHNLEFEVVKDGRSHEVRLGFDRGTGPADAIDVTTNLWLAEGTRKAMDDPDWRADDVVFDAAAAANVRDSNRMAEWEKERDALEEAMPVGQTIEEYKATLNALGYTTTAASDTLPTHADYEIIKDKQSFEVQIERDVMTGRAISVEVEANIWIAKETAAALREQ